MTNHSKHSVCNSGPKTNEAAGFSGLYFTTVNYKSWWVRTLALCLFGLVVPGGSILIKAAQADGYPELLQVSVSGS